MNETIDKQYRGTTDSLGHHLDVKCEACSGDGWVQVARGVFNRCTACDGIGYVLTESGRDLLVFLKVHQR